MRHEKVGSVRQCLAVRGQSLDAFCRFRTQPGRQLRTFNAELPQLGVLERGKGGCWFFGLKELSPSFPGLAEIYYEFEVGTFAVAVSTNPDLACSHAYIMLPFCCRINKGNRGKMRFFASE